MSDEQTVLHLHRRADDGAPGVEVKVLSAFEIKDADKGIVEAMVMTLNEVDHDKEVVKSIVPNCTVLLSPYRHGIVTGKDRPVGKGTVVRRGDKAFLEAQFFMDMHDGRETFAMVKGLGKDGEWSLGFEVVKESKPSQEWKDRGAQRVLDLIKPVECSPVFRGASLDTMTVAVKEADAEALEAKAKAEAEAAEKAAEEQAELEAKQREEDIRLKALTEGAVAEYKRVQRSLQRMGLVA